MKEKDTQTNSYLTFKLGEEEFGIHVSQVLNILEMTKITSIPQSPDFMKGVINLRGMVLPVVDIRLKFGLPEIPPTNNTCIIVMDLKLGDEIVHIGSIVDEVVSVLEIEEDQIEGSPNLGKQYQSEFIQGMAREDDAFIMLLDMERVFNAAEISSISESYSLETTT